MKVYKLWLHRFPKASDTINRDILWHKLQYIGVKKRLSSAFKALYNKVLCAVKKKMVPIFAVKWDLKQGCPLSPVLFNIFINDLSLKLITILEQKLVWSSGRKK